MKGTTGRRKERDKEDINTQRNKKGKGEIKGEIKEKRGCNEEKQQDTGIDFPCTCEPDQTSSQTGH